MSLKLGRMPFGKHSGKLLSDIAEDHPQYFEWLLEQEWLKSALRKNICIALGLDNVPTPTPTRPLQLIIGRVEEALLARGWSKGESQQMIRRLMEAHANGKA